MNSADETRLLTLLRVQTRLGVLAARSGIVIPASSLFEITATRRLILDTVQFQRAGLVWLYSPTSELRAYAEKKLVEYEGKKDLFGRYDREQAAAVIKLVSRVPWLPRIQRSAFKDLSNAWSASMTPGGTLESLFRSKQLAGASFSDQQLVTIANVPQKLEGRAFILDNILESMPSKMHPRAVSSIANENNRAYVESYTLEHEASIFVETPEGNLSFGINGTHSGGQVKTISQHRYLQLLQASGLANVILHASSADDLLLIKQQPAFAWFNEAIIFDASYGTNHVRNALLESRFDVSEGRAWFDYKSAAEFVHDRAHRIYDRLRPILKDDDLWPPLPQSDEMIKTTATRRQSRSVEAKAPLFAALETSAVKTQSVFLVHGRDAVASRWMRDFLRALGLSPLEWPQAVALAGSGSPYTMDVIKAGMDASQATIVFFTPDEIVRLRPEVLKSTESDEAGLQSRPNVWFEAGLAMGLYPQRTILVTIGPCRQAERLGWCPLCPSHQ